MNVFPIPVLKDNYIWIITNDSKQYIIIDPGDAIILQSPILQGRYPIAILLTHHHHDHTAGVQKIVKRYPQIEIYGPSETHTQECIFHTVNENMLLDLNGIKIKVFETPGHTKGHVSYYSKPYLFCGDTLFSAGCGRILGGTTQQLYYSLLKLSKLPEDTKICCAHEYTLNNLIFANKIMPNDPDINHYLAKVRKLREEGKTTLPSTLSTEKKINLFLRCHEVLLHNLLNNSSNTHNNEAIFAKLRELKDNF